MVECRTPEREVGGSKPTTAVLCPWARHFTPRKYWLITQEAVALSRHAWKIVDWDVKPQHKQTKLFIFWFTKSADPNFSKTGIKIKLLLLIYIYIYIFFFFCLPWSLSLAKIKNDLLLAFWRNKIQIQTLNLYHCFHISFWFTNYMLIFLFYHI